jgi:hypothetical protein
MSSPPKRKAAEDAGAKEQVAVLKEKLREEGKLAYQQAFPSKIAQLTKLLESGEAGLLWIRTHEHRPRAHCLPPSSPPFFQTP